MYYFFIESKADKTTFPHDYVNEMWRDEIFFIRRRTFNCVELGMEFSVTVVAFYFD